MVLRCRDIRSRCSRVRKGERRARLAPHSPQLRFIICATSLLGPVRYLLDPAQTRLADALRPEHRLPLLLPRQLRVRVNCEPYLLYSRHCARHGAVRRPRLSIARGTDHDGDRARSECCALDSPSCELRGCFILKRLAVQALD